tara:strand:+ start:4097 stop:4948 length:852 start_codon:yes stop_codon:yes gene_type:complete
MSAVCLTEYCGAAKAIESIRVKNKGRRVEFARSKKLADENLESLFKASGPGAYIPTHHKNTQHYCTLKTKVYSIPITPKSVADALRDIQSKRHSILPRESVFDAVIRFHSSRSRQSVQLCTEPPINGVLLNTRDGVMHADELSRCSSEIKSIGQETKSRCAASQSTCKQNESKVVEHLSLHSPTTMCQRLRIATPQGEEEYNLKAKSIKRHTPKKIRLELLKLALETAYGSHHPPQMAEDLLNDTNITNVKKTFQTLLMKNQDSTPSVYKVSLVPCTTTKNTV